MEGIWNLINFVQIGGGVTIVGGLIGLYFGFQIAASCTSDCNLLSGYSDCVSNCPDAYMYAIIGALPGIIIAVVEYFVKKSRNPV